MDTRVNVPLIVLEAIISPAFNLRPGKYSDLDHTADHP